VPLTRRQWAELNKMEFWKGVWGTEACISHTRRQKTNLKSRQHILRMIIQYLSWNTEKSPKVKRAKKKNHVKYHITCIHSNNVVLKASTTCKWKWPVIQGNVFTGYTLDTLLCILSIYNVNIMTLYDEECTMLGGNYGR
jgi:hypothetical protein